MKRVKSMAHAGLLTGLLVLLAGCDVAEQSARELAAKAEQEVKTLGREKLKESLEGLNQQVDKAQQSANKWLGEPPKPVDATEPNATDNAANAVTPAQQDG